LFRLAEVLPDNLRPVDDEECGVGLAGHGAREESLSGSRRTVKQHSLWGVDAETGEEFWMLERELDHLADLVDDGADAADVVVADPSRHGLLWRSVLREDV